jgi:hypothetical protein
LATFRCPFNARFQDAQGKYDDPIDATRFFEIVRNIIHWLGSRGVWRYANGNACAYKYASANEYALANEYSITNSDSNAYKYSCTDEYCDADRNTDSDCNAAPAHFA